MRRVYLDSAATSFPKAPGVAKAMTLYIEQIGSSVGRGFDAQSLDAMRVVMDTRERLCRLFGFDKPENCVFTKNVTESLNVILKGLLEPGDHVIITPFEHNAVMRPLSSLLANGIEHSICEHDGKGNIVMESIEDLIRPETKAVIMMHASNVSGNIFDVEKVGEICKGRGIYLIVDGAQSAGFCDIDMRKMNIDALCFTGHKSLLGPTGVGGFLISEELSKMVRPLIEGGTGSNSKSELQPDFMPDKFEAGTMNIAGIYGLNASLKFIEETGLKTIRDSEARHARMFADHLSKYEFAKIAGSDDYRFKAPVVSVDFEGYDNAEIAQMLSDEYGVSTRVGMHCSPHAHKSLATYPQGTVRFSFSYFNTDEDILYTVECLDEVIEALG